MADLNTRILVIDDEQVVRDTFCEILATKERFDEQMNDAAAALFGEPSGADHRHQNLIDYQVDVAINGRDGLEKVRQAIAQDRQYALIFCDMRMPGWDGLTTVQQIRRVDNRAEIIFVTAYSDHSAQDITTAAGPHVGYHCKPFEADEIRQIATKGICDWNKLRDLESLINITSQLSLGNQDLNTLLKNILQQITNITDNRTALLLVHKDSPSVLISIGDRKELGESIIERLKRDDKLGQELQTEEYLYLPMSAYGVLIMKDAKDSVIEESRIYLIRLFVQQASRAIDNANLELELAAKKRLSDLGQAASGIVHDLKQPINIISGAARLGARKLDNPQRVEQLLGMISNACVDMNEHINDILHFSDTKQAQKKPEMINALLEEIVAEYAISLAESSIAIIAELDEDAQLVIDKNQIRRAIKNIINNATDALRENDIEAAAIRITGVRDKQHFSLLIADNGPGIPEPIKDSLFEAFVTKDKANGTGVGLAITKEMVLLNGASIDFDSSGEGTTFRIKFPM